MIHKVRCRPGGLVSVRVCLHNQKIVTAKILVDKHRDLHTYMGHLNETSGVLVLRDVVYKDKSFKKLELHHGKWIWIKPYTEI